MLAHRMSWPQHWVDQADPLYIADLMMFLVANSDHEAAEADLDPKVRESKAKQRRIQRKVAVVKRREGLKRADSES